MTDAEAAYTQEAPSNWQIARDFTRVVIGFNVLLAGAGVEAAARKLNAERDSQVVNFLGRAGTKIFGVGESILSELASS